jgi:predicted transcriptional regulator of viral defense system
MARQMTISMHIRSDMVSAEQALLAYLRWRCPNHTITNVSEAAFHMNYSRRQIQRALKRLTDKGRIVRAGKGRYFLKEE